MPSTAQRWIEGLPWRWALGGFAVGCLWVMLSVGLTGGFSSPYGGFNLIFFRVTAWLVTPLTVLGGAWGFSERWKLQAAAASDDAFDQAVRGFLNRQVVRSMICGLAFGIFIHAASPVRAFRPWTSEALILENLASLLGFVAFALPVGLLTGLVAGRGLKRRLAKRHDAATVF